MKSEWTDLLSAFSDEGVEYLIVGALALSRHGVTRATGDLDIWIRASDENADRVFRALARFGAPLAGMNPGDLAQPGVVFQIGVAPLRIDVLTSVTGVEFEEAWNARQSDRMWEVPVSVISREHLIRNKRAVGRPQDLLDADLLEQNKSRT